MGWLENLKKRHREFDENVLSYCEKCATLTRIRHLKHHRGKLTCVKCRCKDE